MSMRIAWIAMVAIALSACATTRTTSVSPVDAAAEQAARESFVGSASAWSMSGRVAVSNGKDGGSGRIEWKQDGARYEVALAAPVTRKSWRVTGGEGDAVLEGLDGGPRTGASAHDVILEATHWDIPVDALSAWLLGDPNSNATVHYAADGRLARLEQDGWTVTYTDWAALADHPGVVLPQKLEATKGEARVRLAIDDWSFGPGP